MINILPGYVNTMSPMDAGRSLRDLVMTAIRNIDLFDKIAMDGEEETIGNTTVELSHKKSYRERFDDGLATIAVRQGWTLEDAKAVRDFKRKYPPDRLYRIRGGLHSATRGSSPLAIIVSYRPGKKGHPVEAGLAILGFANDQIGSAAKPIPIPGEGLEDVTEAARKGTLPELRMVQ